MDQKDSLFFLRFRLEKIAGKEKIFSEADDYFYFLC